jgi:hypothetical protein
MMKDYTEKLSEKLKTAKDKDAKTEAQKVE